MTDLHTRHSDLLVNKVGKSFAQPLRLPMATVSLCPSFVHTHAHHRHTSRYIHAHTEREAETHTYSILLSHTHIHAHAYVRARMYTCTICFRWVTHTHLHTYIQMHTYIHTLPPSLSVGLCSGSGSPFYLFSYWTYT